MIPQPLVLSWRMRPNSLSTSGPLSALVGSSMMKMRALKASALAISMRFFTESE